jgi:hypothetical protein
MIPIPESLIHPLRRPPPPPEFQLLYYGGNVSNAPNLPAAAMKLLPDLLLRRLALWSVRKL